ncbi:putative Kinase superfamily protein [Hibiscus syriacus]|uniref:Putative Kinase superfamily protein n=1 Tax=Hibiscus syriacus TaxID=106335 RepID=A0A6A3BYX1_HIBSY|nr:putative Kinase superfamily protein [Hibiscus syriacus]
MGELEFLNSRTGSAELIGYNDDILVNILVLLPGNSLLRFRNVSKQWFSLISSPYFSRCLNQSLIFPSAIFLRMRNKPKYHFLSLYKNPVRRPTVRSFTFIDDSAGIRLLQSCNGLLLCCSNNRIGEYDRTYYIYNPTTNQYTILPKPGNRTPNPNTVFGVTLAFDPSKSVHYKVVFVRSSETTSHLYRLEIYSSEAHLWSFSSDIPKVKNFGQGGYCCGAVHWIMNNSRSLLRFDVHLERFQGIPLPNIQDDWDQQPKCRYFGECGGYMHLILTSCKHSTRQFDAYEMKNDFSGWFAKYQVDLNALISTYPEMTRSHSHPLDWDYHAFRVLAIVVGEESKQGLSPSSFIVLHIPGKAITYSFKDNFHITP